MEQVINKLLLNEQDNLPAKKSKDIIKKEMLDTAAFDDELMDRIFDGIAQNLLIEIDKRGISVPELSKWCNVNMVTIYGFVNRRNKSRLSLTTLIKLSIVLQKNISDFFPYDLNSRKTGGDYFNEITKELDVASQNYLLENCAKYATEVKRIKNNF